VNMKMIATALPDFKADYIVGSCIDGFHKDPERVARILADPRMMPHEADIKVGNIIFHLSVDALYDDSGNFEGNSLQWENVTEKRQHEKQFWIIPVKLKP